MKNKLLNQDSYIGLVATQTIAILLYVYLLTLPNVEFEVVPKFAVLTIAWLVQLVIMSAISYGISYATAKKPPKPQHAKPAGLEQFDLPTAQEGRPIQVLFGKRYINAPNVVWYGDLKTDQVVTRG